MALQNYITSADITPTVLKDFDKNYYVSATNDHLEAVAISFDVTATDIAIPLNPLLKEYAKNYCNMLISLDKIGTNGVELDRDKYVILHQVYSKEVERLRGYLNEDVILNEVDDADETSRTHTLYRG